MANYISLMLYVCGMEDEDDRLKEVNAFKMFDGCNMNLLDVNHEPFLGLFPRSIYCATYKVMRRDLYRFLTHLRDNVFWEYPECNTLIVQEEEKPRLEFYCMKYD